MESRIAKYFFMQGLIRRLERGPLIAHTIAIALRISAALIVLWGLATIFKVGKVIFTLPSNSMMGGILFGIFYLLAIYAVIHAMILRAQDIVNIKGVEYFMLPVSALLVRLFGEIYASYAFMTAIGGGIFVWFTGKPIGGILSPIPFFFPTGQKPEFMYGVQLILTGVLLALCAIILSYIVAEIMTAISKSLGGSQQSSTAAPRVVGGRNQTSRFG